MNVLDEIQKVSNVDEIICVDDGSDDDSDMLIKIRYPDIKLVRLNRNVAKLQRLKKA